MENERDAVVQIELESSGHDLEPSSLISNKAGRSRRPVLQR